MTEFKTLSEQIEVVALAVGRAVAEPSVIDASQNAGELQSLSASLDDMVKRMEKFSKRAAETDPDKKQYGPKMVGQIQDAAAKLAAVKLSYDSLVPAIEAAAVALKRLDEEARVKAQHDEEAAQKHAAELLAQREQAAAAAREQTVLAERRKAEDVRIAAEKLRVEAEARKKEKEEAAKRKVEQEKEQRENAAVRAAAEAADVERKGVEERKRRSDELVAIAKQAASSGAGSGGARTSFPAGQVTELNSLGEFQAAIESAGDAVVLVDLYASWCGPCKRVAPAIEAFARESPDVRMVKVDADRVSEVGAAVGIRAFPTFHVYWRKRLQESFSGADINRIRSAVAGVSRQAEEVLTAEAVAASLE